jgi:hypothetical protein
MPFVLNRITLSPSKSDSRFAANTIGTVVSMVFAAHYVMKLYQYFHALKINDVKRILDPFNVLGLWIPIAVGLSLLE